MARKFLFGEMDMAKLQPKLLLILYLVLAMVIVSLKPTFNLTKKVFGSGKSEDEYGAGEDFGQMGFILHILVFALLAAVPFFFIKEYM
jgi:hypothetical protein